MVTTNCNTKDENQVNDNPPPTPLKKSSPKMDKLMLV